MLALPAPSLFWYPLLAALIPLLLAVSAWPRRFARGARTFIACQFPLALIFVAQVLIRTSSGLPAKTVLYQLWTVAAVWTAFLGLLFSLEYTGRSKRFPRWALLVVALPLVGLSALIMTNSVTGWIWQRFWDDGWLRTDLTALGFAGMIYVCLLSVSCTVILFVVAARAHAILRWQALFLALCAACVAFAFASEVFRLQPVALQGTASILGAVGLTFAGLALFRFRAFDLTPIARDALVEQTSHGMLVLDEEHRVIDLNPAARRLLGTLGEHAIGKNAQEVFGPWPDLLRIAIYGAGTHAEVTVKDSSGVHVFDATVSPFLDLTGGGMERLVVWFDITQSKAVQAEVQRQRSAFAAIAERDRLARELHDGLAQSLGAIKMQSQAARDALECDQLERAHEYLSTILEISQDAHEEIRDFLLGAKSTIGPGSDFAAAVAKLADHFAVLHGLRVYVSPPEDGRRLTLDPATQVHLLRIIQESLSNVRKHARVSTASVSLSRNRDCLEVTIHDDGVGFEPEGVPGSSSGHYGLSVMRERAAEFGGRVDVMSAPGRGTAVFISVPLNVKEQLHAYPLDR